MNRSTVAMLACTALAASSCLALTACVGGADVTPCRQLVVAARDYHTGTSNFLLLLTDDDPTNDPTDLSLAEKQDIRDLMTDFESTISAFESQPVN